MKRILTSLTSFKNFFANNTYLKRWYTHADMDTWFSIETILIFVIFVVIFIILYFHGDLWQCLDQHLADINSPSSPTNLPLANSPLFFPAITSVVPSPKQDPTVNGIEKDILISDNIFNFISNLTIIDWTLIGGSILVIGLGIYYYPTICAGYSAWYNSSSSSSNKTPYDWSDTQITNDNLKLSLEKLDKIEAQLERVTTVADKLDETLKNLKIATEQVNTNLEVIDKAAEMTSGAVERSWTLLDRLFTIHKATQTDINTVPSPEDFNIPCSLELSELFPKYPILPSSFIIIATAILTIHLLYKMYHDRGYKKIDASHKGEGGSILQRSGAVCARRKRFITSFRSTLNHIHKLKWFIVGYLTSCYIGLFHPGGAMFVLRYKSGLHSPGEDKKNGHPFFFSKKKWF